MTSIELTNIVGLTYPYTVYVCNVYGLSCILVATINAPVPASVTITLPPLFLMAPAVGIKLIASGGISTFDELPKLAELGCEGTIIGKAIYEGRITLKQLENYIIQG